MMTCIRPISHWERDFQSSHYSLMIMGGACGLQNNECNVGCKIVLNGVCCIFVKLKLVSHKILGNPKYFKDIDGF